MLHQLIAEKYFIMSKLINDDGVVVCKLPPNENQYGLVTTGESPSIQNWWSQNFQIPVRNKLVHLLSHQNWWNDYEAMVFYKLHLHSI